jgi:hypothetical protein
MINTARISRLCAQDWGLWRTVTMNLEKVGQLAQSYTVLEPAEKQRLAAQVAAVQQRIREEPKSFGWKVRSKVGDRVKWYQEVDDVS